MEPKLSPPSPSTRPSLLASPVLAEAIERWKSVSRRTRLAIVAGALVAVSAGGAIWAVTRTTANGSTAIEHSLPYAPGAHQATTLPKSGPIAGATNRPAAAVPASTKPSPPVVVDVGGAVVRPGVYKLDGGSRVADALAAAGGVTLEADDERLNKAEKLADGIRIFVPRRGVTPPVVVGLTPPVSSGSGSVAAGVGATPAVINLNTADATQLDALPGVGPATAAAIVQYRTQHGPFASVDKLTDVPGIGPAKLERWRSFLTV